MAQETLEVIIKGTDQASGIFKSIGGIAGGVLKAGLLGAGAAFGALSAAVGFSIKEASEAQTIQSQLAAVIESTGGVAGVTADMANDLATSLSHRNLPAGNFGRGPAWRSCESLPGDKGG